MKIDAKSDAGTLVSDPVQNKNVGNDTPDICPESSPSSYSRRNFITKAVTTSAAVGVGSTLIASPSFLPKSYAKSDSACANYCDVQIDQNGDNSGTFCRPCCPICPCSPDVPNYTLTFGATITICPGPCCPPPPLIYPGQGIGSNQFCNSNKNQYGLDFYTNHTKRMSITNSGSIGIGTDSPQRKLCVTGKIHSSCGLGIATQTINTTLAVNGSISAKVASPSSVYSMKASDFAVLANASSAAFSVTLPPANTAAGMIVFVKKMDNSSNIVLVEGATVDSTTDMIEASPSRTLNKQYDSVYLISNGAHEWFVLENSLCNMFAY